MNALWTIGERTVSDRWTLCERWTRANGERWTQNCERWTHDERTLNARWTDVERTVNERKNGKVERFRDCNWAEMVEVYLIPKVCLTSKPIKTKYNFLWLLQNSFRDGDILRNHSYSWGPMFLDYQIFTRSLGCIFHNWFVELQFKTIYYMCSLLNVHVNMNSWIRVTQEHWSHTQWWFHSKSHGFRFYTYGLFLQQPGKQVQHFISALPYGLKTELIVFLYKRCRSICDIIIIKFCWENFSFTVSD